MYELKNGSERLINVLINCADDDYTIKVLANVLNYIPEQLVDDIRALKNRIDSERD